MANASVPAAKGALLALLAARAELSGVSVTWGHPGEPGGREFVCFGDTDLQEVAGSLGNRQRREQYTLELWVVVHREGNDARAAEERVWALTVAVEASLRASPSLGLGPPTVLTLTAEFGGAVQSNFIEDGGRTAQARISVNVSARI